ncbi:TrmH family RNA methyltransferase [Patescibacteria group bacterium]|nr:MAG: TrmH family RNA methyltransferase [Patescibacteria group bacterium]
MALKKQSITPRFSLILHNIRSTQNVGAIFRTGDGAGVDMVFLSGYTPTPLDKFNRSNTKIAKTALGAEKSVSWEHHKSPTTLIRKLKKEGVRIIGVEQSARSVSYTAWKPHAPIAVIFGNEVLGVSKQLLALCDEVVEIPMHGGKESLNVSVAAGIILFKAAETLTPSE